MFIVTLIWIGLASFWYLRGNFCFSNYSPRFTQVVNYADVLATHISLNNSHGLIAFFTFNLVGIILIVYASRRWFLIRLLIFANLMIMYITITSLFCHGTSLVHLQTIEFDDRLYHLTYGEDVASVTQILYLHECDSDGTNCRGRRLAGDGLTLTGVDYKQTSFYISENPYQLEIRLDEEPFITFDPRQIPNTIATLNTAKITAENATQTHELLRLNYAADYDLTWSPNGDVLAVTGGDVVWLHHFDENHITTLPITSSDIRFGIYSLAVSPNGEILAGTNSLDGPLYLWDMQTGEEIASLDISYTGDVAFDPLRNMLAVGHDRKIVFYDLDTLTETIFWDQYLSTYSFDFSPDGKLLAAGGYDHGDEDGRGFVRVWDIDTGRELLVARGEHLESPSQVAFSPDGRLFAYPTRVDYSPDFFEFDLENKIHIWNDSTQSEVQVLTFPGETFRIRSLAFSPDGQLLVTASDIRDKGSQIHIWDVKTGMEVFSASINGTFSQAVAFRPNGELISFTTSDGSLHLWGVVED